MTLKTPLQVIKSQISTGVPSIIDSEGQVVVSFGNFRRRSLDWCWKAARQITHSVNGSVSTQLVTENRELRTETERLKAEVNRLKLSFAFQCHIGNLSLAQVATALNTSQSEVIELMRKLPSPVSHSQGKQEAK